MRYLLLFGILIAASATLPFVRMDKAPTGQPVAPVEITTLGPETAPVPDEAAGPAAPDEIASVSDVTPEMAPKTRPNPAPEAETGMLLATAFDMTPQDGPDVAADTGPVAEISAEISPEPAQDPAMPAPSADLAALPPHMPVPEIAIQAFAYAPFGALARLFDDAERDVAADTDAAPAGMLRALAPWAPNGTGMSAGKVDLAAAPAVNPRRAISVNSDPLGPVEDGVASLSLDRQSAPIIIARIDMTGVNAPAVAPAPVTVVAPAPVPAPEAAAAAPAAPATKPAPAETASGGDADLLKVTASALNMREGPSSSHPVVAGLVRGAVAEVIGETQGGWVQVRLKGSQKTGWLFTRYVEKVDGA